MRKEVLFAIIFGTIFGLVTAFGVWRLNSSISSKNQPDNAQSSPIPSGSPTSNSGLTIAKPSELSVLRDSSVKIAGITKADSWVVASGEKTDFIIKAGSDSSFEVDSELVGGLNQVMISSFTSEEKEERSENILTLIYSSNFPSAVVASASPQSSPTDSIRERVEDKIKETQNAPTAYIGSITDISENTLNIKNSK